MTQQIQQLIGKLSEALQTHRDGVDEDGCNHTMEGEYCPEHGLMECGMHESMGGTVAGAVATSVPYASEGLAEGSWEGKIHYGVNYHEPIEPGDKITWYYSNHYPEIEGTVVGWKDGKLRVKSVSPLPGQAHTDLAIFAVPKNNIMSHTKQGVAEAEDPKKDVEAIRAAIARMEREIADPNPHIDREKLRQRIAWEKRRLNLYRDVEGVAEGDAPIDFDWYRKQQQRQTRAKQKPGVAEGTEQGTEQGLDNKYRRMAKAMVKVYNTNPEVKASVDASPEPLRAMVYDTGVVKNPERLDGTAHYHKLVDELESILHHGREGVEEDSTDPRDHRGAVTDSFYESLERMKTLAQIRKG